MSFTGEYHHTIDAKGRLIVPARLRPELEGRVVLAAWMEGCIAVWSEAGWQAQVEARLLAERQGDARRRSVTRAIAASAHTDEIDTQGRITVPPSLRDHAGIERDVIVIGALDHAEIWDPQRWEQERTRVLDGGLEALAQELNF